MDNYGKAMSLNRKVPQEMTPDAQETKPGHANRNKSKRWPGGARIPKALQYEIVMVLKKNCDRGAHVQKKVGPATQEKREVVIREFFGRLYFLNYKLKSIHNIKQKHLVAVFNSFEKQGQSPSTLQNKISIMRIFCEWIDKTGMVGDSRKYVQDKTSVRR